MPRIARVACPECGVDMNPHAVKLIEPRTPDEAARVDPALGLVPLEIHCCAGCGASAARQAGDPGKARG